MKVVKPRASSALFFISSPVIFITIKDCLKITKQDIFTFPNCSLVLLYLFVFKK